ncbi:MAG: diphthine--ammonia ligase [archaeon]|nr:diphthine--ammonia ligase [archaeon]
MCGIIGIFHKDKAKSLVESALVLLKNRGKDASNIHEISSRDVLGHTLHAVVNHVPQPLQREGLLTANCEIYNWTELSEKYSIKAKNDAEFLIGFLDKFKLDKLEELDGVFAFGYYNDGTLYLARDLFGVKPLWFIHTRDEFAFVSEKKVLEKLWYLDIQELNPRTILKYNLKNKSLEEENRTFVSYLPEHKENHEQLKQETKKLLEEAIAKRIPNQKFGLLFSGGIDSTFIAKYLKENNHEFTCYTAVLNSETIPSDLESAQKVAEELGLNIKIKKISLEDIPAYLTKIVPLIEDSNVVKVGVALTFYLACELAKEDGCKVVFSGLGSEEIFAGYERHKRSGNINQECVSGLLKMYERDLYRDDVITMDNNLELRLPFLDRKLVEFSLKIPEKYKIQDNQTKLILREIALDSGLRKEFAFRKKTAAQYGSRIDNALGKLAKQENLSKSEYLQKFYPAHNVKLAVLFSSGKDSTYAAYIMKKQNYELGCLVTMKSLNPDSYMFHTPAIDIAPLQAEAMGLPIIVKETRGEKEKELEDLKEALKQAKDKFNISGVVTGAVYSTYQRDRIEKVCDSLGLKIFSPLWHKEQIKEMKELLQHKFEIILSSIAADGLDESWLNRLITEKEIEELQILQQKTGFQINGEGGEYESLVLDCPLFMKKIVLEEIHPAMDGKYCGRIIIKKASLQEK